MKLLIVFAVVAFVACCNGFGIPEETPTQEESPEKPTNNEAMDQLIPSTDNDEDKYDSDSEKQTNNAKKEGKDDDQAEKKPEQPVSTHHAMSVSSFASTLKLNGKVLQDKHGKQTMMDDNGKITVIKEGDAQ